MKQSLAYLLTFSLFCLGCPDTKEQTDIQNNNAGTTSGTDTTGGSSPGTDATAPPVDTYVPPQDTGSGTSTPDTNTGTEDTGPPPECTPETASSACNDFDNCTTDTCTNNTCINAPIAGCCDKDADCDDGVECTEDTCNPVKGECVYSFLDNTCCKANADCNDGNDCTADACIANTCVHPVAETCECVVDVLCNDGNNCTKDKCLSKVCNYSYAAGPGCCQTDADCNDNDPTTSDTCQQNMCWNPSQGCQNDAECIPPNDCMVGVCTSGTCQFSNKPGCCKDTSDCDDGHTDTVDSCVNSVCVNAMGSAKSCTQDTQCNPGSTCIIGTCATAAGLCTYKPNLNSSGGAMCCTKASECGTTTGCDAWVCNAFMCNQTPTGAKIEVWSSNWDDGTLQGWTVAGDGKKAKWQVSSHDSSSQPSSLYYGVLSQKNYDIGTATSGHATSPIITPAPGPVTLRFYRKAAIEPGTANDKLWLEIVQGGTVKKIWDKSYQNGPGLGWKFVEMDISTNVSGPFQLRFHFDSIDNKDNQKEGVYVDDVAILKDCP